MKEQKIIELVKEGVPFDGMSDIHIADVQVEYRKNISLYENFRPDMVITLNFAETMIKLYGEVKTQVTPKC